MSSDYKNYVYYTLSYFVAIAFVLLLFFGVGYAFEPGTYTLLLAIGVVCISFFMLHFVNRKMRSFNIPGWYKYLNLFLWCIIMVGAGVYNNT